MHANPQTEINVVYANHRNYLSDASDMSIRFGNGHWAGYQSEKLISGQMVPVCSRLFAHARAYRYPEQLLQMPLLHDEERTTGRSGLYSRVKRPPRSTRAAV
jgi:DNA-binding transcriptional LysR family regulator